MANYIEVGNLEQLPPGIGVAAYPVKDSDGKVMVAIDETRNQMKMTDGIMPRQGPPKNRSG